LVRRRGAPTWKRDRGIGYADGISQVATLTDRAELKSANTSAFDLLDEKISLNVSDLLESPACHAGVLTSCPNFKAR
jgi:hypothetical protein